ncbi:MAG: LUD domain-containing protein [Candidatus Aminicenantes bacterium]|nr:LUD domain-containing protein [Candidatus Aminicenantes bacterium]
MPTMSKAAIKKKVKAGLRDESGRLGRSRALGVIKPGMKNMVANFPELREKLKRIKKNAIDNLPQLLDQAVGSLERNGFRVFVAGTAEDARQYIGKIVGKSLVVKSKSNAGKEIGITPYLEAQGSTVIETDLGDRIAQMAKSEASHSLAPAIHIPIERVAELFSEETGEKLECEVNALIKAARKSLRRYLEEADVGISGANAVIAETGSVMVTENEGNIRAVTGMPRTHVVIAGIEKIVPRIEDGIAVIKAAATYGVGQDIGTYISLISGPSRYTHEDLAFLGPGQGPEEIHIVFLKEGREEAIAEGFGESLYCIQCGSCLNFCPVYTEIGEKYGYKYLGGRGAVFSAFHADLQKAQEAGLFLCMGCRSCVQPCAVGMDTPEMIARLREKVIRNQGLGKAQKTAFKALAGNKLPGLTSLGRRLQDMGMKKTPDKKGAKMRAGLNRMGMPRDRLVPRVAKKSLAELLSGRKPVKNPAVTAAFFAGCVVNYIRPDLGLDLLDIMEAQNVRLSIYPEEACCGMPAVMGGAAEEARRMAVNGTELFSRDAFDYLICICPTCATTIKTEWRRLLKDEKKGLREKYENLAGKVRDINDFLINVLDIEPPMKSVTAKVTYHDPCHLAKGLEIRKEPRELLRRIPGVEFTEMAEPDSCCGFGGSFSLYFYDLAKKIGSEKMKDISASGAGCVVTSCPGCMIQIADGIDHAGGKQKVVHMVELLAEAMRNSEKK